MPPRTSLSLATLAVLTVLVGACADAPTAPVVRPIPSTLQPGAPSFDEDEDDEDGENDEDDDSDELLSCPDAVQRTTSRTIGRWGGTITVGRHRLTIPAGALSRNVVITATQVAGPHARVEFQPHGLQFARDARLTLDFSACRVPNPKPPISIVYFTTDSAGLHIEEYLNTTWTQGGDEDEDDEDGVKQVTSPLKHFSGYAVAWSRTRQRTY